MSKSKQRFEDLEVKIAFLEDALNKLSDEYYQQQLLINKLQSKQLALIDKLSELQQGDGTEGDANEKPPHY